MELTNELKSRYYGMHIGETVLCDVKKWKLRGVSLIGNDTPTLILQGSYGEYVDYDSNLCTLLLRHLSSITEEERAEIGHRISFYGMTEHEKIRASVEYADIIRSKGFALPFMGIRVEDMVKAGWIKLKE